MNVKVSAPYLPFIRVRGVGPAGMALAIVFGLLTGWTFAEDNFGSPLNPSPNTPGGILSNPGPQSGSASGTSGTLPAKPATDSAAKPARGPLAGSTLGPNATADAGAAASKAKAAKKSTGDPVAAAMALPHGKILTKQQQEAYDALKADKGAALRQALDDMAQATTTAEKSKALKAIREARLAIRTGMASILAMSDGNSRFTSSSGDYSNNGNYSSNGSGASSYSGGYGGSPYGNYPYGNYPSGGYGSGGYSGSSGGMQGGCMQGSGRSHR